MLWPMAAFAVLLPPGTVIPIRLKTPVSTRTAKPGDRLEAVVLAGVCGAIVRGSVQTVRPAGPDTRAQLRLRFDRIERGGVPVALEATVAGVDNAREEMDGYGNINGILEGETITGRLDAGIDRLSEKYSAFASILSVAKNAIFQPADPNIAYDAGVEMELRLSTPLEMAADEDPLPPSIPAITPRFALEPFRTMSERPSRPSDITNLAFVGSEASIRRAFTDAGWSVAGDLNSVTRFEAVRAVAEQRGYKDAPVSTLLLEGQPPRLVFEKTNNTFARRHHLRIWRRPGSFRGEPVWAAAGTHDIGISYSERDGTFIHRIDPQIDREREKVIEDLVFAHHVKGVQLVDRPQVPVSSSNATGDAIETDGRLAVVMVN